MSHYTYRQMSLATWALTLLVG
eukprot:SAG31_NODE_42934_length_269_cov_0.900000_1_plen_21_part_10